MPMKIPFLDASESLQQRWAESGSSKRISAQIYVFLLLIAVGLLRHYLLASAPKRAPDYAYGSSCPDPGLLGAKDETVGEIEAIYIYPIKSCSGVSVPHTQLTAQGFELDRRWMVVRPSADQSKCDKLSLREEPRLTWIQPVIDAQANTLRLTLTHAGHEANAQLASELGVSETVLRPSEEQLAKWKCVAGVQMYGDLADGRIAALAEESGTHKLTPSEWITKLLGYPVELLHFDTSSNTMRKAFPIFKPPSDAALWSLHDRDELNRQRGIEFQDEYPLLITSLSSLTSLRTQLSSALSTDLEGGCAIRGLDPIKWSNHEALTMMRFRPNIVIKGDFPAFSEDSWERIWILPPSTQQEQGGVNAMLQLVARCQRCLLTAVDPVTAEKDPSVPLKLLNRSRMRIKKPASIQGGNGRPGPCFGMYAIPLPLPLANPHQPNPPTYGQLNTADHIKVRWRPYHLDDEPDRK